MVNASTKLTLSEQTVISKSDVIISNTKLFKEYYVIIKSFMNQSDLEIVFLCCIISKETKYRQVYTDFSRQLTTLDGLVFKTSFIIPTSWLIISIYKRLINEVKFNLLKNSDFWCSYRNGISILVLNMSCSSYSEPGVFTFAISISELELSFNLRCSIFTCRRLQTNKNTRLKVWLRP